MSKVIAITGAGQGLGRALARRFATEGETVVLLGRTASKVEAVAKEIGDRAYAFGCDVSSPSSVRDTFGRIAEAFSHIDVLINNAALYELFPIDEATDEQIVNGVNTNLTGAILCIRAAVPLMRQDGHIINVSSDGVELPFPLMSVYQSCKAGIERLTTSLQRELEPKGIRVSYVRAAAMTEAGKSWDMPADLAARFAKEAKEAGINLRNRPVSEFTSVTPLFRALIDLPADVHATTITLCPRHSTTPQR